MTSGFVCIAGIEQTTCRHIRPTIGSRLSRVLLTRDGGIFDLGRVIDIGTVQPHSTPPEVEDHFFDPSVCRHENSLSDEDFWELIRGCGSGALRELFGEDLEKRGDRSAIVAQGGGTASLGFFIPTDPLNLYLNSKNQVRVTLQDRDLGRLNLSVTDVRLFAGDWQPKPKKVMKLSDRLAQGKTVLGVGLTRLWEGVHWLQVTGVFPKGNPLWKA